MFKVGILVALLFGIIALVCVRAARAGIASNSPAVEWSGKPGCNERHLKRRSGNPLFAPARRVVTQEDLSRAKSADSEAFNLLQSDVLKLALELPKEFPVGSAGQWRARIDDLRYRCVAVGGDNDELMASLIGIRQTLLTSWRILLAGDLDALRKLDDAEEFVRNGEWRLIDEDLAQLSGCVPREDTIPTVLTFKVSTLALLLDELKSDADAWPQIKRALLELAEKVRASGDLVAELSERMDLIREK